MAKKKVAANKGQAVRDYLANNPEATATVVIPALAKEGITVSPGLVNNIRSQLKKVGTTKKAAKKRAAKRPRPATASVSKRAGRALSADDIFEAKKLAEQLGGIAEARDALDVLESLR